MPAFLHRKLAAEYPGQPSTPYKIMNSLGFMRGNKETPKGRMAQMKHQHKISISDLMKRK